MSVELGGAASGNGLTRRGLLRAAVGVGIVAELSAAELRLPEGSPTGKRLPITMIFGNHELPANNWGGVGNVMTTLVGDSYPSGQSSIEGVWREKGGDIARITNWNKGALDAVNAWLRTKKRKVIAPNNEGVPTEYDEPCFVALDGASSRISPSWNQIPHPDLSRPDDYSHDISIIGAEVPPDFNLGLDDALKPYGDLMPHKELLGQLATEVMQRYNPYTQSANDETVKELTRNVAEVGVAAGAVAAVTKGKIPRKTALAAIAASVVGTAKLLQIQPFKFFAGSRSSEKDQRMVIAVEDAVIPQPANDPRDPGTRWARGRTAMALQKTYHASNTIVADVAKPAPGAILYGSAHIDQANLYSRNTQKRFDAIEAFMTDAAQEMLRQLQLPQFAVLQQYQTEILNIALASFAEYGTTFVAYPWGKPNMTLDEWNTFLQHYQSQTFTFFDPAILQQGHQVLHTVGIPVLEDQLHK